MLLRTSPIRCLSDSIVTDGSEMIQCEGRQVRILGYIHPVRLDGTMQPFIEEKIAIFACYLHSRSASRCDEGANISA
jgi:hypothetical protein